MIPYRVGRAVLLLAVVAVLGCGGGRAGQEKVYTVTGKITMGGGPVPNASITFSPKDKQPVAVGRTGADGSYTLTTYNPGDGAAAGNYGVLVTKTLAAAGTSGPPKGHDPKSAATFDSSAAHASSGAAMGGSAAAEAGLPERYSKVDQTSLSATVKPGGDNKFDFDLTP
ncbi:MAG TPA: carboxypeptidase-like regulatory domain-containing protein [Planctomycetaceae bacterium]|nr:carboxypeptidase-like regulatory domain-containing protein [Planctomycetaceae bacterium]